MSFDSLPNKDEVDPEVASFIQMESQKAELQAQVLRNQIALSFFFIPLIVSLRYTVHFFPFKSTVP